jgi:hypothetical protein
MSIAILIILAWLMCASAAFAVAGSKGRSAIGFGMLGLLSGPIGLMLAAVASPVDRGRGRIACPSCAESIVADARRCRFCGHIPAA